MRHRSPRTFPGLSYFVCGVLLLLAATSSARFASASNAIPPSTELLTRLYTPILLAGDDTKAFRDPLLLHAQGKFWLFFSLATNDSAGAWWQTAYCTSVDLSSWSAPVAITPRDRSLNFCSPGSIVQQNGAWVLALQTYPTPKGEKFGNDSSRLWLMRSPDLEQWGKPTLLSFLGPDVPREKMPRMIDPCMVADKDEPGKWWCFCKIKQTGV